MLLSLCEERALEGGGQFQKFSSPYPVTTVQQTILTCLPPQPHPTISADVSRICSFYIKVRTLLDEFLSI
jgi:hypothetical protein